MAGGRGEPQRQARAARPGGVLAGAHQAQHGHGDEEHGRGVLPQGLARGPHARPQREDARREHGLFHGPPAAHGQEERTRRQAREEGRGALSQERGARLVEGEEGPRQREDGGGQDRGEDRIDRDPVAAHGAREGLLHLGILVEVEVGFLRQAGRGPLRGPRVSRADGPAVGQQKDQQPQRDPRGAEEGRRHDPRRPLERLLPGADAHQRTAALLFPGARAAGGLAFGLAAGLGLGPGAAAGEEAGGVPRRLW